MLKAFAEKVVYELLHFMSVCLVPSHVLCGFKAKASEPNSGVEIPRKPLNRGGLEISAMLTTETMEEIWLLFVSRVFGPLRCMFCWGFGDPNCGLGVGRSGWDILKGPSGFVFPWRDAAASTWRLSLILHSRLTYCRTDWMRIGLHFVLVC